MEGALKFETNSVNLVDIMTPIDDVSAEQRLLQELKEGHRKNRVLRRISRAVVAFSLERVKISAKGRV